MTRSELRNQADQIIEKLPEETGWEDLMYSIYVRKKIDQGLADAKAGRVRTTEEIRKELG
jgi:predicted transcriptional regulator